MATIPTYWQLMLPLLELASRGEATLQQAVAHLIAEFGLTAEDTAKRLPSGQTVIYNRTGWAKTELTKAGLLIQTGRGSFAITDAGRSLLAENPPAITRAFLLERFPDFQNYLRRTDEPQSGATGGSSATEQETPSQPEKTPEEQLFAADAAIQRAREVELLAKVRGLTPDEFEQLVVDLLVKMGYGGGDPEMSAVRGGPGDGGIDGVVQEDELGLDAVYVQAKRYKDGNNITAETVRGFVGSLVTHRAMKGVFVTASDFTKDARSCVNNVHQRVVLIDGGGLVRLMLRHGVGVQIARTIEIKKLDEDYFAGLAERTA